MSPAPVMQCIIWISPPHLDVNVNPLLDMSMGVLATTAGTLFGVRILEEILMLVGFLTSAGIGDHFPLTLVLGKANNKPKTVQAR